MTLENHANTRKQVIESIYPFEEPPESVIEGTYVIVDPTYQFRRGFHQTSSAMLVSPHRRDEKLIVPAVALTSESPALNISVYARETLPKTFEGARRYCCWWGSNPLRLNRKAESDYTPERAEHFLGLVVDCREIYADGLAGREMNLERLGKIMGNFLAGDWYRYYVEKLPEKIKFNSELAEFEVGSVFKGFEDKLLEGQKVYSALGNDGRYLLQNGFNFIFDAEMTDFQVYVSERIPQLLSSSLVKTEDCDMRSPFEISAEPRGITADQIKAVYLPDEVHGSKTETIALNKLKHLGIETNRVQRVSDLSRRGGIITYDHCGFRYGKFTGEHLKQAISHGSFVHIFDFREL